MGAFAARQNKFSLEIEKPKFKSFIIIFLFTKSSDPNIERYNESNIQISRESCRLMEESPEASQLPHCRWRDFVQTVSDGQALAVFYKIPIS